MLMPRLMARLGGVALRVWHNGGLYQERDEGDEHRQRAVVLLRMPSGLKARPVVEVSLGGLSVAKVPGYLCNQHPHQPSTDDSERRVAFRLPLQPSEHSCGTAAWPPDDAQCHIHLRRLPCVQHL